MPVENFAKKGERDVRQDCGQSHAPLAFLKRWEHQKKAEAVSHKGC